MRIIQLDWASLHPHRQIWNQTCGPTGNQKWLSDSRLFLMTEANPTSEACPIIKHKGHYPPKLPMCTTFHAKTWNNFRKLPNSSSSYKALKPVSGSGLINYFLPNVSILYCFLPVVYIRALHIFQKSSTQRVLGLPIGLLDMGFHLLIFCTLLFSVMRKLPNYCNDFTHGFNVTYRIKAQFRPHREHKVLPIRWNNFFKKFKWSTTMQWWFITSNKTNTCIYRYVDLLYYKELHVSATYCGHLQEGAFSEGCITYITFNLLVLTFRVTYPSKNACLKMATIAGRNM